jgi:hypothetical protein
LELLLPKPVFFPAVRLEQEVGLEKEEHTEMI